MIPTFEDFIYPMLTIFANEKTYSVQEAIAQIAEMMKFAEADWRVMTKSGGKPQITDRCLWSLTYLKQSGLLEQPKRGYYRITPAGLTLLGRGITTITRAFLRDNYPSFADFIKRRRLRQASQSEITTASLFDENPESEIEEIMTTSELNDVSPVSETGGSLDEIYSLIDLSKKLGLPLTPEQEAKADELEEAIIKQTILPMLVDKIAPALMPIRRELVLVVDYIPGQPLNVKLSRKRNIAEVIDAKTIELDPEAQHRTTGPRTKSLGKRAESRILRVVMPDGRIIFHDKAVATFVEAVKLIGPEKIRNLGIVWCNVPLISNTRDKKYGNSQKDVGNGWLLITHSGTTTKKDILDHIARELGLNMKVEIVTVKKGK